MGPMLIPGVGIYMVGTAPVDIITEKAMRVRHSETTGQVLRRVKEQVLIHHTPPYTHIWLSLPQHISILPVHWLPYYLSPRLYPHDTLNSHTYHGVQMPSCQMQPSYVTYQPLSLCLFHGHRHTSTGLHFKPPRWRHPPCMLSHTVPSLGM